MIGQLMILIYFLSKENVENLHTGGVYKNGQNPKRLQKKY